MYKTLNATPTKITSSTAVYTGACEFRGFLLGTDGVNDPVITIYNGTSNAGGEIVPTSTYDASQLGLNGVTGLQPGVHCDTGIYIEITCEGTVEVVPYYTPFYPDSTLHRSIHGPKYRG